LYINNGKGNFALQPNAIPDAVETIAGCVTAGDYDGDGYPDLFIGGRVSKKYPLALLMNKTCSRVKLCAIKNSKRSLNVIQSKLIMIYIRAIRKAPCSISFALNY
jgi:hypothetical protein